MNILKLYVDEAMPTTLHDIAFIPALLGQADEDQLATWKQPALDNSIIGCYCQTELGHGSNVRGLETTAIFDLKTDTFELHSPTLTSLKWYAMASFNHDQHAQCIISIDRWPGALGCTATHAIVYARLEVPEASGKIAFHGIHPFIMQVSSKVL